VASGIDSMVIGEPQILSQVRSAYRRSEEEGALTPLLSALVRRAVRTGRRARAETAIGANPAAMVEAGADLAAKALGTLEGRSLLVVGAGTMAELAVKSFGSRGVGEVVVLNRSPSRAERLAVRHGAAAGSLTDLGRALAGADLAVTVTGATGLVVEPDIVRDAIPAPARRTGGHPARRSFQAVRIEVNAELDVLPGALGCSCWTWPCPATSIRGQRPSTALRSWTSTTSAQW